MTSVFGNILVAGDLEKGALLTLRTWMPTYLREVERQVGIKPNSLKNPENYTNRNSFDATPGEVLPKVVCISPGLLGQPTKNGKQYRAIWGLGVGVAMAAATEELANDYAKYYAATVRAIMLQKQELDNSLAIQEIVWLDETYDDLIVPNQSTKYRACGVYFGVDIEDVTSRWMGPADPDQPSYDPIGQAQLIEVDLVKESIT